MAVATLPSRLAIVLLACAVAGWAAADGWSAVSEMQTPRQEVAAVWFDGAVVVVGGFGADRGTLGSVERWRPGDDVWQPLASLAIAVHHPAAAVVAGRLVVVGGYRGPGLGGATDAVQVYDPTADAWSLAAPMPGARGGLAAVAFDDRLVAVGGARDGVSVAEVAAYDPVADAWEAWAPLGRARDHLGLAVLHGRLHAVGGREAGADFALTAHEVFDPASGVWAAAEALPTGRSGHAVAVLGGCLYAFGGEGNAQAADGMFDEVERFVASSGAWEALPPMPVPRHGMGAVAVDERIVVPAGATAAGFAATAHADAYTPPACP